MRMNRTFRFMPPKLNAALQAALNGADIDHAVDRWGYVYYHDRDTEAFEDILATVRSSVFESWQVLSCPADAVNAYRQVMRQRKVRFVVEVDNNRVEFLIPGDVDPHSWPLDTLSVGTSARAS